MGRGLTPLQRSSQCILQLQPTGQLVMELEESEIKQLVGTIQTAAL